MSEEEIVIPEHYNDKCSICGKWLSIDNPLEYYSPAFCNNGIEEIIGRCCFKKQGGDGDIK